MSEHPLEKVSEGIVKCSNRVNAGKEKLNAWKVEDERRDPLKPISRSERLVRVK